MIDTDKYEGHTEGPWNNDCSPTNITTGWYIGSKRGKDDRGLKCIAGMVNGNKADAQLIADAPLFLEAYKRLREELFDTHAFYSNMEQMLAFAVGIKQGLLTDMSMDNLVDAVNRDYHDRLNEHMDGRLRKND